MTFARNLSSPTLYEYGTSSTSRTSPMKRVMSSKGCLKKMDSAPQVASLQLVPLDMCKALMGQSVSFHTIQIKEYAYDVGDNPSVTKGCPIQLAWEPQDSQTFGVLEYDRKKPTRRTKNEMRLPPGIRRKLLKDAGATSEEIQLATDQAREVRKFREQSNKNVKWDGFHFALEKTRYSLRKVTSLSSFKSEMEGGVATDDRSQRAPHGERRLSFQRVLGSPKGMRASPSMPEFSHCYDDEEDLTSPLGRSLLPFSGSSTRGNTIPDLDDDEEEPICF